MPLRSSFRMGNSELFFIALSLPLFDRSALFWKHKKERRFEIAYRFLVRFQGRKKQAFNFLSSSNDDGQ